MSSMVKRERSSDGRADLMATENNRQTGLFYIVSPLHSFGCPAPWSPEARARRPPRYSSSFTPSSRPTMRWSCALPYRVPTAISPNSRR